MEIGSGLIIHDEVIGNEVKKISSPNCDTFAPSGILVKSRFDNLVPNRVVPLAGLEPAQPV